MGEKEPAIDQKALENQTRIKKPDPFKGKKQIFRNSPIKWTPEEYKARLPKYFKPAGKCTETLKLMVGEKKYLRWAKPHKGIKITPTPDDVANGFKMEFVHWESLK